MLDTNDTAEDAEIVFDEVVGHRFAEGNVRVLELLLHLECTVAAFANVVCFSLDKRFMRSESKQT